MDNGIFTRVYAAPEIDRKEILRYAGVRGDGAAPSELLERAISEAEGVLAYRVCYRELPVNSMGNELDLGFMKTSSDDLIRRLSGCESIILFAATVGIELDRLTARYAAVSPTVALLLQAFGAERIESLCDLFDREIAEEKAKLGFFVRPRFSPGYGDFPITAQKEIFGALDCPRKIGLTLNESLLMSPTKSVTAIIGIGK